MEKDITLNILKELLLPLGYQFDASQEKPTFWKRIKQNDLRSAYAFSIVIVTLDEFTVFIQGLNEPCIKRAIDAGIITISSPEEFEELEEVLLESTLDNLPKLKTILPFLEQQLATIENFPIYTKEYKKALSNIELLVDAANEVEW